MNGKIGQVVVLTLGLFAGLLIIINVLSNPYGNSISGLSKYFTVGLFAAGFFFKRLPVYLLIFLAAYSDLFKRLLVVGETVSRMDVTFVLMACPILMAGMAANSFLQNLFAGTFFRKDRLYGFLVGICFAGGIMLKIYGEGIRGMGLLRGAAVQASFAFLPFVILSQFETMSAFRPVVKFFIITFIPVFLYALHQNFFGYLDFELVYRASGLSLKEQSAESRTPSTLSQPNVVSYAAAMCMLLMFAYRKSFRDENSGMMIRRPLFPLGIELLLVGMILLTIYLVRVRGLYFFTAGLIPTFLMILRRKSTIWIYGFFGTLYLGLLFSSGYIMESGFIDWWNRVPAVALSDLFNADHRTFRIATFVARLEGFHGMVSNPDYWTLFGQREVDFKNTGVHSEFTSHDQVSRILLAGGVVGLAAAVTLVTLSLVNLHKLVWMAPLNSRARALSSFGITILLGTIGLSAVAGGGVLVAFPGPTLLFLSLSVTALAVRDGVNLGYRRQEIAEEKKRQEEEAIPVLGGLGSR